MIQESELASSLRQAKMPVKLCQVLHVIALFDELYCRCENLLVVVLLQRMNRCPLRRVAVAALQGFDLSDPLCLAVLI